MKKLNLLKKLTAASLALALLLEAPGFRAYAAIEGESAPSSSGEVLPMINPLTPNVLDTGVVDPSLTPDIQGEKSLESVQAETPEISLERARKESLIRHYHAILRTVSLVNQVSTRKTAADSKKGFLKGKLAMGIRKFVSRFALPKISGAQDALLEEGRLNAIFEESGALKSDASPVAPSLEPTSKTGKIGLEKFDTAKDEAAPRENVPELGIDLSAMDASARPQDDFYRYVNGSWLDKFKMPADKARFGVFDGLAEQSETAVKAIIDDLSATGRVLSDDEQKIAGLYKSFMDVDSIEARGLTPLAADFKEISDIQDKEALAGLFARSLSRGVDSPIAFQVNPDGKNTSSYIGSLSQSGLGLPDRDYYFNEDQGSAGIRAKYLAYIATLLKLSGEDQAEEKAQSVFALEKELAQRQWTRVELRDPIKAYNKIPIRDLGSMASGFDWEGYLRAAGVRPEEAEIIVSQPSYFSGLSQVIADQSLENWKLYMKVRTLDAAASFFPKAYADAAFDYHGRALNGQPEMRARWKRGVGLANSSIGDLIGRIYVEKYFPETSLLRMKELVENLRSAFQERISSLEWMSAATKTRALEKLAKFLPKIGYPDRWKDYSDLRVNEADLMGNLRRVAEFNHRIMVGKLGRPVDRGEWLMNAQTVNAYYNPLMNEIVFPAAILRFPFFDPNMDDAVIYGAIGAVIGHEMSHGFDDEGSQFDGDGNLKNWWTPEDEAAFKSRGEKLAHQYDAFEPLPGRHINGELTEGENIGDFGGLTIAYYAYQAAMKGVSAPVIGGFTGVQRFFMSWAQVWRSAIRDEALSRSLAIDPHSPAPYRVNGVVRNMPEFYKAFGLKEGDKLFLSDKDRVSIW